MLSKMEAHVLARHEYSLPMHMNGQIEKPSPIFWQQLARVRALHKGLQKLLGLPIHGNTRGNSSGMRVTLLEPIGHKKNGCILLSNRERSPRCGLRRRGNWLQRENL
jgi:hypothetical protein